MYKRQERLCAELKLLDPEYYKIVDLKNPKRVAHALEICYMTGKTYTCLLYTSQGRAFEDIRKIVPEHFLLVPGVGAQGGSRCV